MAEFIYEGVTRTGEKVKGSLNAPTEGDLRILLRGQGIRPVKISTVGFAQRDLFSMAKSVGSGTVSLEQLVHFTRQLQVLVGSGIPLIQALDILIDQTTGAVQYTCQMIRNRVSEGAYLWETLAQHPKVFPKLYVALIRAGESSGALDTMLKRVGRYLEDADRLRKMIKGALMYPIIVLSIGAVVIGVMLVFVIPKFEAMLTGAGQKLPGITQFVINSSHFLQNNILVILGATAAAIFGMKAYIGTEEGRAFLDRITFRLPIFGSLVQKAGVARFCRTMFTLLNAGVPLIDAIEICRMTMDNKVLEEAIRSVRPEIEQGKTLGGAFARVSVFPRMAVQMIAVGESTGALDQMLEKIADFYEAEVEIATGGLGKLIEPIMLVGLGGIVGGMLLAMYMPIFKLAGAGGD
jgi:type IV pilus assembly protein PilC